MPQETGHFRYSVFGPQKLWTQFALPLKLFTMKNKPDVFFTPSHYSPRYSKIPTAIALMDVSYIHFPHMFATKDLYQLKNWTAYSVKKARRVFTISKSSKNDILKEYHLKGESVVVTYPGVKLLESLQPTVYEMKQLQDRFTFSDTYFLFVGTLQPRKNIQRLVEAFSLLLKKHPNKDMTLLLVGKKGWQYDEILQSPEKIWSNKQCKVS